MRVVQVGSMGGGSVRGVGGGGGLASPQGAALRGFPGLASVLHSPGSPRWAHYLESQGKGEVRRIRGTHLPHPPHKELTT